MSALLPSLAARFERLPPALRDAHGLAAPRRAALDAALASGLPGPRAEAWKYTSLRALAARAFADDMAAVTVDPARLAAIPSPRLVFVNGRHDPGLSDATGLPSEVDLRPLSAALAGDDARAVGVLARRFDGDADVFAWLNAALATEGVLLRVPAETVVAPPVHIVFVGAPGPDAATHLRHLVELRQGARVSVVEHHLGAGTHRHLANHLLHAHVGRGATLVHARVQAEDAGATTLARTDAVLASDATYRRVDLELGAALARHEFNVALQGERAALHAGGVLLADGRRHVDTRLDIVHQAKDTRCTLPWRGLADARGRVVFHGGIRIDAGADGSDAALSSRNLLLSDAAEIDTQPVLVIHADEVKAAHGATVGTLDETALFYLRSRGLPRADARRLLVQAFLREPLAMLQDAALAASLGDVLAATLERTTGPAAGHGADR